MKHTLPPGKRRTGSAGKYNPVHIDTLYRLLDELGHRLTRQMMVSTFGISEETLRNWLIVHPDFKEAFDDVLAQAKVMYLDYGVVALDERGKDEKIDAGLYKALGYAIHRLEWQPKQEVQQVATLDISKLTQSATAARILERDKEVKSDGE